jgi:hypothetical protein
VSVNTINIVQKSGEKDMKRVIEIVIILFAISSLWGQSDNIKIIKAIIGYKPDFSPQGIKKWEKGKKLWEQFHNGEKDLENLTSEEDELIQYVDEFRGLWDVISGVCNWYCGGGPNMITASSFLPASAKFIYMARNAHDLDFRTAWVEGVKGYGIGEFLEYHFPPLSPRVNKIQIYNGYVKSVTAWKNNSRVKKLKLYVNNKPYAILELQDTWAEQIFSIEPMRSDSAGQDLILKFEILEVYKGDKWDDVAITEIYFDGLDVHCFPKGTKIKLSDGTEKAIEKLKLYDEIISYNLTAQKIEKSKILELATQIHDNLINLYFDGFTIISTNDHPYFVDKKGWCSVNPEKSNIYKNIEESGLIAVGDNVIFLNEKGKIESKKLIKIKKLNKTAETFTITRLDKNKCFFANGLLVAIEELDSHLLTNKQ